MARSFMSTRTKNGIYQFIIFLLSIALAVGITFVVMAAEKVTEKVAEAEAAEAEAAAAGDVTTVEEAEGCPPVKQLQETIIDTGLAKDC